MGIFQEMQGDSGNVEDVAVHERADIEFGYSEPTDEDVYHAYFRLLYHNSWMDERHEKIVYAGNGRWNVDATISLNRVRLAEPDLSWGVSDGTLMLVPLLELEKRDRFIPVEVRDACGRRLKVFPDEECYLFEWLALMGTIVHANRCGLYKSELGDDLTLPSSRLAELMSDRIRSFDPPDVDQECFIDNFEQAIKGDEALLEEWAKYRDHVPGFAALFCLFAYCWIPIVQIDVNDKECEILSVKFSECYQLSEITTGFWRHLSLKYLKVESTLKYSLRRVGAAESELFEIFAPEWTTLSPFKDNMPCEIIDESEVYRIDPKAIPLIDADGLLTKEAMRFRVIMAWDDAAESPKRRFAIPDGECDCPSANWGQHVSTHIHNYAVNMGYRAQSKKRGRAYASFLAVSFVALLYMVATAYVHPGEMHSINSTTNFLTSLCVLVPLLALVFSNLHEGTNYFREKLLPGPLLWVRVGVVCDVAAFLSSVFHAFFFNEGLACIVNVIVLEIAVVLVFIMASLMAVWLCHNDEEHGSLVRQHRAVLGGVSKIPIRRVPR